MCVSSLTATTLLANMFSIRETRTAANSLFGFYRSCRWHSEVTVSFVHPEFRFAVFGAAMDLAVGKRLKSSAENATS